ncbi:MAG TPA: RNA polymerase sigma factor [Candidatus Dormibacteraeota bacterium]|nr:RNA polymerase sigma factor [Candidatus Dormibacteraeota bacterium]
MEIGLDSGGVALKLETYQGATELDAFERELTPLLLPAYRLAYALLHDRGRAEDAVQDACLRAWDRRRSRRAGTPLRPWFLAIVSNRCRDVLRGRWSHVLLFAELGPLRETEAFDPAERLDIRRAIRSLPMKARLVIALRFYLDLPYEDIASILGCSINAAKLRAGRAAATLRSQLGAEEKHHG